MGDDVEVISDYGNVCIVQNSNGERFSVSKDKLDADDEIIITAALPDTNAPTIKKQTRQAVSKSKVPAKKQQSLF